MTARETVPRPRVRPRFTLRVRGDRASVYQRLTDALREGSDLLGAPVGESFELAIPTARRHTWSPHLRLWLDDEPPEEGADDGRRELVGRFGPHPHIWTLYVAIYAHLLMIAGGATIWGVSQWLAGEPMVALYVVPLSVMAIGVTYLSAFYGQALGATQMEELRAFVLDALELDDE